MNSHEKSFLPGRAVKHADRCLTSDMDLASGGDEEDAFDAFDATSIAQELENMPFFQTLCRTLVSLTTSSADIGEGQSEEPEGGLSDEPDEDLSTEYSDDTEEYSSSDSRGSSDLSEIGRMPSLNRFNGTLRNASRAIMERSPHPGDLMAKLAFAPNAWYFPQIPSMPSMLSIPSIPSMPSLPLATNWHLPSIPTHLIEKEEEIPDDGFDESTIPVSDEDRELSLAVDGDLGCIHYLRNCKVRCVDCLKFYPCRLCHDEKEDHGYRRHATKHMLCMLCGRAQPAAQACRFCGEQMAGYYCEVCKMWSDDADKPIFHCDDCGICRQGLGLGIDVFHCPTCNACMDLNLKDHHRCIPNSTHRGCPICLEDMFYSTAAVMFMRCGHPIHKECFDVYIETSYRCPLCGRTVTQTSALTRALDEECASEQLPPEYQNKKVPIQCRDCRSQSRAPYHLAGLKCCVCGSYNTTKI